MGVQEDGHPVCSQLYALGARLSTPQDVVLTDGKDPMYSGAMKRKYENPFSHDKSNSELAWDTGISASHLSLILAGKRSPSLKVVRALAVAVDLPIGEVLFRLPPLVKAKEKAAKKAARKTAKRAASKA